MKRRTLLASLTALPLAARGADYPERPVKIIVAFAPGGGTDIITRILAPELTAALGQNVIVENRAGAASTVGTDAVAKAPADAYTLLASDSTFLINPGLFGSRLPYDTLRDLTGVTMMASAPVVLLAHPSVPFTDMPGLIAYAKANPGKLNYGSGGNGAGTHLAGELLKQVAGIDLTHVPYRGTAPALNDLLGGNVQLLFGGISSGRVHVESGALKALALTGARRNGAMPTVPTFDELGLVGVDAESWWGLYAPTGTPPAALARISMAVAKAMQQPAIAQRLAELGYDPIGNTPAAHTAQWHGMVERWIEVIAKAGVKPD
jgi:tripartite-type tricarboxylate transporter receptor subunit TctC